MSGIFREQTNEEKTDFKSILEEEDDPVESFKKRAVEQQQLHNQQKKPFCFRCANLDMQKKWNALQEEMAINVNYVKGKKALIKQLEFPELSEYGKEDRFISLPDTDAYEPTNKVTETNVIRKLKIGIYKNYKCKVRGCGHSIFHPSDAKSKT